MFGPTRTIRLKVDVLVVSAKIALDRNAMLIVSIKRLDMNIKILAIGDESNDKTRIIDYGADEFALKPMSPENVADKDAAFDLLLLLTFRHRVRTSNSP